MEETRRKMKLGTSDRIILGVGYTLLGLFVLRVQKRRFSSKGGVRAFLGTRL